MTDRYPTQEAVEKIRGFSVENDFQRIYFDLLADRLGGSPELIPVGVVMVLVLLEHDLVRNRDGFTGLPMSAKLAGMAPVVYGILSRLAVARMQEFFPEEFAARVKAEWEAVIA